MELGLDLLNRVNELSIVVIVFLQWEQGVLDQVMEATDGGGHSLQLRTQNKLGHKQCCEVDWRNDLLQAR